MGAFKQENGGASEGRDAGSAQAGSSDAARSARKRTKTGCLTCRKRRIKCDEGKPVCKNCMKSKRQCEGYNQRVVFKPADFQYLPHGGASITFDAGLPGVHNEHSHHGVYPPHSGPQQRSPSIGSQMSQQYGPMGDAMDHQRSPPINQHPGFDPTLHGISQQQTRFEQSPDMKPYLDRSSSFSHGVPVDSGPPNPALYQSIPEELPYVEQYSTTGWQQDVQGHFTPVLWSNSYVTDDQQPIGVPHQWHGEGFVSPNVPDPTPTPPGGLSYAYGSTAERPQPTQYQGPPRNIPVMADNAPLQTQLGRSGVLDEAAIEVHDEDYYDVDTEDEMFDMDTEFEAHDIHGSKARPYGQSRNGLDAAKLDARYFDTFVFTGAMDSYRPEHVANPLKNPATARVFAHFMSETAAVLTTSARQIWRLNPSSTDSKTMPMVRKCIWTHTLPMAALHHQGLLQSMLAISSLQIAKIQGASETPSLKHYAYALKRIHACVGNPKKRLSVPVFAASLLLGYYECMAANHANWQSHLNGARQLVVEMDFAGMTKTFKEMKTAKARQDQQMPRFSATGIPQISPDQSPQDILLDQMYEADENIVGAICGTGVSYDRYGHIGEAMPPPQPFNLETYDTLKDLYWWYCKQDAYHSLISTDPLMMDYSRFTDCPPRAPLGKADAPYGSFDHIVLLLARIADFAVRDRKRKLKVEKMNMGSPMDNGRRTSNASNNPSATPPPNMFSSRGVSHSPSSTTSHTYDSIDLNLAFANALQEWNSIKAALDFVATSLGPYFQPLDAEYQPLSNTPFGPTLLYRSWDISVFWANYNMAMIAALRNHPNMPPAAHVAAAAAAEQTKPYAYSIGRIAASIQTPPEDRPLDPKMGAAMIDLVIPQFFAGIQYTDPSHRAWLVERYFETNRRSGWATASIIAEGCQSGWIRAAEAGRGPPHVRVRKATFSDFRIGRYGDSQVEASKQRLSEWDAENDRKFVRTKASARVHWAIGLMGTEEDVPEESD
ncbi:hypothetical protein E4T50_07443 [Aureobasidium sp. EXF-12298]|nr:hypothetical protein E4T50_07443 [Aureobasidium sp. EXF-12298]